ncbi:hypothetical protein H6G96_31245 [Nostoc sp. FACHB-892]|uniref:TrbI/VirB10 family protein n=1 Tax=Nostoc sp. FACHB-892 TaxID=2692843 RepID=UPI0016898432|nr:TrbI/VirB10 family protein [Nostoc sp. FACHB-892]MBD2730676.1 hypothetical protein [Nostoc sp. FACHB-892]
MSKENNKNGSVSTLEDLLKIDDVNKTNGNKAPEPESLLVPTKHTIVTSPWSRLAIIAVPFGVGFLAIFLMLNGVFNPAPAPKIGLKTQEIPTTEQAGQSDDGDGDARAKLALSDQEDELGRINKNKKDQLAPVPVSVDQKVVPSNPPSPQPAPRPVQNTQPRRVTQTAPQQIRTYTQPPTRTSFSPRPSIAARTFTPQDPLEQINKLRTIGSYGKIAYTETSTTPSLDPAQNQPSVSDEQTDFQNVENDTPLLSRLQNSADSIEKIRPRWQAQTQAKSGKYLVQERQILDGKQTRYLRVGEFANGILITPVIGQQQQAPISQQRQIPSNKRFVAKLTQDLHDNEGEVAIAADSLLAVELVSVDGGYANIQVTSIIKDNNEYPIAEGAISVLGDGSKPLIAKKYQNKGGEVSNDIMLGLFSGLGKIGGVLNQSDTTSIINSSSNSYNTSSSSSSRRDIGGAFLEGAFGKLSDIQGQRTETANPEIAARTNILYIPKDTKITILVNRTLELP